MSYTACMAEWESVRLEVQGDQGWLSVTPDKVIPMT